MSPTKSNFKKDLPAISPQAMASFQEHSQQIINETVFRSLKREEEVVQHGEGAKEVLTAGLGFFTQNLEAAMSLGEVALLEDVLVWAKDRLPHDGVAMEHVLSRFKIYRGVVMEILPEEYAKEVIIYIDWMISYQKDIIGQRF